MVFLFTAVSKYRINLPIICIMYMSLYDAADRTGVLGHKEHTADYQSTCRFPGSSLNLSSAEEERMYSHVTSIVFHVEENGRTSLCKLECREGMWKGPVCDGQMFKYGCTLHYLSSGVEAMEDHRPLQVLQHSLRLPHGTSLKFRCRDESLYLDGKTSTRCEDSAWTSRPPVCQPTSSPHNFSESLAPGLSWEVTGSPVSRGREGELILYQGAIFHVDCTFDRRRGTPQWSWSHNFRDYPTGWLVSEKERNWKFRISIVYARAQDSGTFNCTTPRGLQNSLVVRVTTLLCPPLIPHDYHKLSSTDQHIGSRVSVYCPTGFQTLGSAEVVCRDDGTWSSPLPLCVPVTCNALEISSPHLRVLRLNNTYLGEAEFDCPFGYNISGEKVIWCNQDSRWSASVPTCTAIECGAPVAPENGQILESGVYYVGSTVQIVCHTGFILIGEPIIRCTQSGLWSDAAPLCKRSCSYPGTPLHGSIYPLRFIYNVGDKVRVKCDSGSVSIGDNSIQCLSSGEWSDELPRCQSYL